MKIMMADSSVAWLWAIEYLASFKQLHPSILHELIDEAPELTEDLGNNNNNNTREMVALKCLEHLFTNEATNDLPSVSNHQKITFHPNDSCEHVVQSILKDTSVSDLETAGPDLLKWDVESFIVQKRASMPKSALKQLKDAILEGTHPCAGFLRELSGLVHTNGENCRTDSNGTDVAGIMAPEGSNILSMLEYMNGVVRGDYQQKTLLPLKRNEHDLGKEHPYVDDQEDQGDLHLNAKRFKTTASCDKKSGEQILIPQSGNELVEGSSEMRIGVMGKESCHVERVGERLSFGNSRDKFVAKERLERSPTSDANGDFQKNQCDNLNNANKMPESTPGDAARLCIFEDEVNETEPRESNHASSQRTPKKISVDDNTDKHDCSNQLKSPSVVSLNGFPRGITVEKLEGGTENLYQDDTSSESGGYHHERIDVAMEKSHFLSSQCTLSHASPSNWTELNLCVKCSKDSQLLVCNAVGCPFVVHEKCLGCSPKFDEKGNFYCPFCAYAYAISKYFEAKKKANLARKDLAAFMCKHPERSDIQKPSDLEQHGDEDLLRKDRGIGDSGEWESDKENNKECAHIINIQLKKRSGDKQSEEPMLSCSDVNVMCRGEPDVTHGITHVVPEANESAVLALECPSARELDRPDQTSPGIKCHGDNPLSKDKEVFPSNKREVEGRMQKEVLEEQSCDLSAISVYAGNIDGEETSGNENDMISNYSLRLRRREMKERHYVYPASPQLRRKKVPWTAKEEEKLKEGMKKFSNIGDRTIPWKKILEYGSSVFWYDRTTIDLKDKWRNICKGSHKRK